MSFLPNRLVPNRLAPRKKTVGECAAYFAPPVRKTHCLRALSGKSPCAQPARVPQKNSGGMRSLFCPAYAEKRIVRELSGKSPCTQPARVPQKRWGCALFFSLCIRSAAQSDSPRPRRCGCPSCLWACTAWRVCALCGCPRRGCRRESRSPICSAADARG